MTFTYDYRNRRVRKIVETYDGGSWSEALDRKFVWYNWLLLAELDGEDDSVLKKYTWGPDLAGQHGQPGSLESAGGIGGLLATRDKALGKSYVHFYDANGNTGQLILRADGSTAAHYEYDAYGNVTAQTGSYAADNAWRFSTKQWDDETGQGYWGERYYDSGVGRWVNRDPLEEDGGWNLQAFSINRPIDRVDSLGLQECPCDRPEGDTYAGCKDGKCVPILSEDDKTKSDAVKECINLHERVHCSQWAAAGFDCKDKPDNCLPNGAPKSGPPPGPAPPPGEAPKPGDPKPQDPNPLECPAYAAQLFCLAGADCKGDKKCDKERRAAIRNVRNNMIRHCGKWPLPFPH